MPKHVNSKNTHFTLENPYASKENASVRRKMPTVFLLV